jgi:glycine cleavage system H protein
METPAGIKYTEEHEWVRLEEKEAVVGITDYAQGELGDIVFVELPAPGVVLKQGDVFGTIEAVKTVSELYAPVSGKVIAVNEALKDRPEAVNQAPYGEGWMIRLSVGNPEEMARLLTDDGYRTHVGGGQS